MMLFLILAFLAVAAAMDAAAVRQRRSYIENLRKGKK